MTMSKEALVDKIRERGYWKVIIRPIEFVEKRIVDKDMAARIIEQSRLKLRGWDYPHIDDREGIVRSGPDNISSFCDWAEGGILEFWRLYLNGQFVHYFCMVEDYRMDEQAIERARDSMPSPPGGKIDKFLSIINTLYRVTEIHLFAANMAKLVDFGDQIEISIELGGVEGRVLFFWGEPLRHLYRAYACQYQPIDEKRVYGTQDLIADYANHAMNFAIDIFKEFNWKDPNKDVFITDQQKLLERRL